VGSWLTVSHAMVPAGTRWCLPSAGSPRCRSISSQFGSGFFQYASLGPTFGVVQNAVSAHRRATATALLYICLSVIALGLGPVAALFPGGGVSFASSCPGGAAAVHAAAEMDLACRATLAVATRGGLLVTLGFFAWGSLHYFLAAAGLARSASAARATAT
jgi:hypothetical protein